MSTSQKLIWNVEKNKICVEEGADFHCRCLFYGHVETDYNYYSSAGWQDFVETDLMLKSFNGEIK